MRINQRLGFRVALLITLVVASVTMSARRQADTETCGGAVITLPFVDVMGSPFFCQIAEAYFSGLTNGTSATTYSPDGLTSREQIAAFITRTLDQSLRRGSSRAALNQFWTTTPHYDFDLGTTNVGFQPHQVQSDGADLWVANRGSDSVSRVRACDGRLIENWNGADNAYAEVVAMGRVFVTQANVPGYVYMIDPSQPSGQVTTVANTLDGDLVSIAFDGSRIWATNVGLEIFIITPGPTVPWTVTKIPTTTSRGYGLIYDGTNMWVSQFRLGTNGIIRRLDANGNTVQTVDVGAGPGYMTFDGTNIWVPGGDGDTSAVTVVRASTGVVLATLTGNGLSTPGSAAFDGQRVLVTNSNLGTLSLWKASDLTPIGSFSTSGGGPIFACSDGINFWISLTVASKLARF